MYHSFNIHARDAEIAKDDALYGRDVAKMHEVTNQYHNGLLTKEDYIVTMYAITTEALMQ